MNPLSYKVMPYLFSLKISLKLWLRYEKSSPYSLVSKEPLCIVGPQASVEPLKDYSARKFISLQSGSLSTGPFRPVSCFKTSWIVMEATPVNKQRQYNMFLFQCHWFSASLSCWRIKLLQLFLSITAVRQKHKCSLANLQGVHVCMYVVCLAIAMTHLFLSQGSDDESYVSDVSDNISEDNASVTDNISRQSRSSASVRLLHTFVLPKQLGDPLHTHTHLLAFNNAANDCWWCLINKQF